MQTGALGRSAGNHMYHTDGVVEQKELDTDARETTIEPLHGSFRLAGGDVDRVRVEFLQNLWKGFFDEIVHVHPVHILVIDDVKQISQFVSRAIHDAQILLGILIGVEAADQYAQYYAKGDI